MGFWPLLRIWFFCELKGKIITFCHFFLSKKCCTKLKNNDCEKKKKPFLLNQHHKNVHLISYFLCFVVLKCLCASVVGVLLLLSWLFNCRKVHSRHQQQSWVFGNLKVFKSLFKIMRMCILFFYNHFERQKSLKE